MGIVPQEIPNLENYRTHALEHINFRQQLLQRYAFRRHPMYTIYEQNLN